MKPVKPDLTLSQFERPRKVTLDLSNLDPAKLTLMDALDIVSASGVQPQHFQRTLANPNVSGSDKAKLLYAFAWVIARRVERGLTWDEMLTYDLEITGEMPSEEKQRDNEFRAKAIMGVVRAAGVSPEEAENLTLAQVNAVMPKRRRHVG